jgi:hypothetical protein
MRAPALPEDRVIMLSAAAKPDGLSVCVLRASADLQASVFTDIFNLSLSESVTPTCFNLSGTSGTLACEIAGCQIQNRNPIIKIPQTYRYYPPY